MALPPRKASPLFGASVLIAWILIQTLLQLISHDRVYSVSGLRDDCRLIEKADAQTRILADTTSEFFFRFNSLEISHDEMIEYSEGGGFRNRAIDACVFDRVKEMQDRESGLIARPNLSAVITPWIFFQISASRASRRPRYVLCAIIDSCRKQPRLSVWQMQLRIFVPQIERTGTDTVLAFGFWGVQSRQRRPPRGSERRIGAGHS